MSTSPVDAVPSEAKYSYQPITIILIVILLIFFFLGFFSLYFSRFFIQNIVYTWHLRHSPTGTPVRGPTASVTATNGLDILIIQSFPTFTYSTVKDHRKEKYGLECAICLIEFIDEDSLRLLTSCCHVFHQECIDLWFESHKTCPVCRRNLNLPDESPAKYSPVSIHGNAINETTQNEALQDSFTITIKDDNEDAKRVSFKGENFEVENKAEIFCRSHSTGHSIVRNKEKEQDKFSLRLPENVKTEIMRGHNWSKSCTTFGDYRSKSATGDRSLGEASGGDNTKG
ncbi:unnamed protein product [Fraxinus pennsylvanica]|uniref:RING-type E3 ubiquitin transferase n=1 Tax=Fraxinus pennsylvanica TaxID=56036 RepID=A0AAD1ZNF6_9LAMI|nr:unnamed protein product [Fraxinus pennsylvanica]